MYKTIAVLLTVLLASTATAAQLQTSSRNSIRAFRRACVTQKPLICNFIPVGGSSVGGKVTFRARYRLVDGKPQCFVRIKAVVTGLPGTKHGFHIHTYGDTSDLTTGGSTGGHFTNPEGTSIDHGLPNDVIRHWGDFGNLRAVKGTATYNRLDRVIRLPGIVGRGITLHELRDQGAVSQPTGGAGSRIAVCVIGFANPASL